MLGSTIVIMHSSEEPNSFFGGMAAPEWNSYNNSIEDPVVGECSWLFKLEAGENKYFVFIYYNERVDIHKWECINRECAIYGNEGLLYIFSLKFLRFWTSIFINGSALTESVLFMEMKAYFIFLV